MLTRILQFFAAPVFEDEEKQRVANLLNTILNVVLGLTILMAVILPLQDMQGFLRDLESNVGIITGMVIAILLMRFLLRRGNIVVASTLLSLALLTGTTAALWFYYGIRNAPASGYLVCIIVAGLLIGGRAALVFTVLCVAAELGVWYAEITHIIKYEFPPVASSFDAIAYGVIFIMGGLLLRHAANNVSQSLERARFHERTQVEANQELQKLRDTLEQQVADRTRALERRSRYLEASSQVSHTASSILDIDELIARIVDLIRERFDLYHVSMYMLDESGHWAEYRGGTGEAGRLDLERKFRLEVGGHSMVGQCTATAQARVAQDVSHETERVADPLLPDTRSEAVLPLIARGRVIGALDAQSAQLGSFDQDTVGVLQAMSDQVAIALDNAHLFAQGQQSLEETRRAYGELTRDAWAKLARESALPGYRYSDKRVFPLREPEAADVGAGQDRPAVTVPIKVRGHAIGTIDLRREAGSEGWTQEDITLIQSLTEQLAVALDSARLYQDTQRRAVQEQLTREITDKMHRATDMESLLKITLQEMAAALDTHGGFVQLVSPPEAEPIAAQDVEAGS
jgi:GAF domain-containing protein